MGPEHRAMQPLRFKRTGDQGQPHRLVSHVPEPVPPRSVAPDWNSPTEDNGVTAPRADMHIALVAPDPATAEIWRRQARLIRPPLWKGKVFLHVVTIDKDKSKGVDPLVLQAMVDLGFADSTDIGLIGYPEGHT